MIVRLSNTLHARASSFLTTDDKIVSQSELCTTISTFLQTYTVAEAAAISLPPLLTEKARGVICQYQLKDNAFLAGFGVETGVDCTTTLVKRSACVDHEASEAQSGARVIYVGASGPSADKSIANSGVDTGSNDAPGPNDVNPSDPSFGADANGAQNGDSIPKSGKVIWVSGRGSSSSSSSSHSSSSSSKSQSSINKGSSSVSYGSVIYVDKKSVVVYATPTQSTSTVSVAVNWLGVVFGLMMVAFGSTVGLGALPVAELMWIVATVMFFVGQPQLQTVSA